MNTSTMVLFCLFLTWSAAAANIPGIHPERIRPGTNSATDVKDVLGKPTHVVREGAKREYYFYERGAGSGIDTTVALRSGVVEYVTYLCDDTYKDVMDRHHDESSVRRQVATSESGYRGALTQVFYEQSGKGYVLEPRTQKVKACIAFAPGTKPDAIGN